MRPGGNRGALFILTIIFKDTQKMATKAEILTKVNAAQQTQRFEKSFDLVRSFVAKADTADSVTIPLTNEGPFIMESMNIRHTSNSSYTGHTGQCFVKLKLRSQSAGSAMSSDYIPVQLIATPGAESSPRYGARPFNYFFPKGDALVIEYDNREPAQVNAETYTMANERIEIVITGKIYPIND